MYNIDSTVLSLGHRAQIRPLSAARVIGARCVFLWWALQWACKRE